MSPATQTEWRIAGEEVANCNCDWGCPCQFNANPTTGRCEALITWDIREGHYGSTSLDGVRFTRICSWPGAIHEGDGTRQTIVDESATDDQLAAIEALDSGEQGGAYWEIFASVCPNRIDTVKAPIEFEVDRDARTATIRVGDIGESRTEPIKNPVSGEEHRAQISLPEGFEYTLAEVGNSVYTRVNTDGVSFDLENTYAQLNEFDWSN
jgi:hypothetical protein